MNPYLKTLAKELAHRINEVVNLPFMSEEEEELFFQLIVSKVLEVALGHLLTYININNASIE